MTVINPKRLDYYICHLREKYYEASRNKAILSFRYDSLEMKANITQVTIILLSTIVTFLESLKAYYHLDFKIINIVSIVMTTLIALIMAIYRFFEIDKKKENVGNSLKDHTFIINKFRKVGNVLSNMKLNTTHFNNEQFNELSKTYDNEVYENYISIRENFDSIFSFKELIHYRRKYRKHYLKDEIIKREIELIKKNKDKITTKGYVKHNGKCKKWFCCKPWCIDYYGFIYDIENEQDDRFIKCLDRRLSERVELTAERDSPNLKGYKEKTNAHSKRLHSVDSVSHSVIQIEPKEETPIAENKNSSNVINLDSSFLPEPVQEYNDEVTMTIQAPLENEDNESNKDNVSITQSRV